MRSRISFFNRTIFGKNVTHFWPIWVVYSMFCIWSMPVYSYFNIRRYSSAGVTASEQMYLKVTRAMEGIGLSLNAWVIFIFAIASAVAVFSYLYKAKSANMIHALPVCREELFTTNYLSGLLFLVVPQLISFLLTVFVWFGNGVTQLEYLLQWLGVVTVESFFAYSLGVFCVMLTGNIVAAPAYFILVNYLYKGLVSISNMVREALVYGFTANEEIIYGAGLAPLDYFTKNVKVFFPEGTSLAFPKLQGMECLKWYALAGVVLVLVALVVYKKRQLECAGDMIAISWIKPLVRWFGAILCAGLFGQIIQATFFAEKIILGEAFPVLLICWLIGGGFSFLGIEMIIEKRFMVFRKGLLIQGGMFLVLVTLFLGALEKDVFHLERRIPDADQIAELYMQGSYERYITNPEKIQESITLQEKMIASKEEYQQYLKKYYGKEECNYLSLNMVYVMKNGKRQVWNYNLPLDEFYLTEEDSAVKKLMEQEANPEDYMAYYFTEQYSSIELQPGGTIDWVGKEGNFQTIDISTEEAEELLKAFQEDVNSGNYRIYPYSMKERVKHTYVNTLTICYIPPKGAHLLQYGVGPETTISDGVYAEFTGIVLTKECTNTIALLEKMGYVDDEHRLMTEQEYEAAFDTMDIY